MTCPSRFPAAAKRRAPAQLGSGPISVIAAALLTAALSFQPPAHSAEKAAVARAEGAVHLTQLEKGFWICDYVGTTQGAGGEQAVVCGAIFEELKQKKFGGDFEKLLAWWRVNKVAQHKALESTGSAQF